MSPQAIARSRKPGRPARSEADARRDELLEAGLDGFLRHGFAGTSLDDIARSAHVAKRTIYEQFGGKEGLFAACIERAAQRLIREFSSSKHPAKDLRGDLTSIGCTVLAHVLKSQSLAVYRLVVGESDRQPELARVFYENGPGRIIAEVAGLLERNLATDRMLPTCHEQLARDFVGLVVLEPQQRAALGLFKTMSTSEIESHVASKVANFLAALPRRGA